MVMLTCVLAALARLYRRRTCLGVRSCMRLRAYILLHAMHIIARQLKYLAGMSTCRQKPQAAFLTRSLCALRQ
jgi:hypothetical protein